ncbi:MAG TPA: prepilin-type N-terminal cleavage/methylation domain-containing protein [Candidatus Ozemobacteraceae bacterium]|nr:prepilin-type N-terminal cleavage/methylation domain-containing protein [Candidatus Ozemobacteraceae bacterium]
MAKGTNRPGFTLAEVLVACGVLSLLLAALFGVFRGGSAGFKSGQWQIQTQKKAQLFLIQLRELLEKANNAESYFSNSTPTVNALPIYAKTGFLNSVSALSGATGLMYFSITTSYNSANPLIGAPETRGTWAGVSLAAVRGNDGIGYKLVLKRSGVDTDHILCGPPYAQALAGPNFTAEPANRRVTIELEDVQSIGFNNTQPGTVEVTIVLSRNFGGGRVASFRETVRAKLMNVDLRLTAASF